MTAPVSERPASRPLAPLWARVVIAAGLGMAATALPGVVVVPSLLVAAAAVAALEWPHLRPGRVAALGGAALAGFVLGGVGSGSASESRWIGALAGAASAVLARPGEAGRPALARLAAFAGGGALVGRLAGLAVVWTRLEWIFHSRRIPSEVQTQTWAAAIAIAVVLPIAAAGRVRRGAGRARVAALLILSFLAIGVERGDFRSRAEVRLDTGDVREYYLGLPFVPVTTRAPEPDRARLLRLAEGLPELREEWRDCPPGTLRNWEGDLRDVLRGALRYLEEHPRVARLMMEDLAELVAATRGAHFEENPGLRPECWKLVGQEYVSSGSWLMNTEPWVLEYCLARGYDPRTPAWRPAISEDEPGLIRQLASGTRFERVEAARRLVTAFPASAGGPLAQALRAEEPRVRAAAALGLADLGDPSVLARLREARLRDDAASREWGHFKWREATTLPAYDEAIARLEARAAER